MRYADLAGLFHRTLFARSFGLYKGPDDLRNIVALE